MTDARRNAYLKMVEDRGEVDGRFSTIKRLAVPVGYFSLIFTALDKTNGKTVVLKVFHPDHRADPYRWACFQREATLLQRFVGQPDILQVICGHSEFVETLNTTAGLPFDVQFAYFATELATSDVLAAISDKRWDAQDILLAFRAMCRSIQRLHAAGIVYRDPQGSHQKRPTVVTSKPANESGLGLGCFTPSPPEEASLFSCANSVDRI